MFLKKKAQSTAEYAIIIGLVIAVAAGVLQVALKSGIRQKNKQAMNYLLNAGSDTVEYADAPEGTAGTYSQDYRQTTIDRTQYVDEALLEKGGAEKKFQRQKAATESVSIETIDVEE